MNEFYLAAAWFILGASISTTAWNFWYAHRVIPRWEKALQDALMGWRDSLDQAIKMKLQLRQYERDFGVKSEIKINKV